MDHDAIVVGSGAGGLTAAVALARAGKRVLVLEQHEVPGGWCHSFTLRGYSFSPGVHYLGELGEGGALRAIYRGLGVGGDLTFVRLNPDGFDHVRVGDVRFDIPAGWERLEASLARRFPRSRHGVGRVLRTLVQLDAELTALRRWRPRGLGDWLLSPAFFCGRVPRVLRWGWRPLGELLDRHLRDPRVKTILAAQCGDYGLPPSQAPAALHAAVARHYADGAWAPLGGGMVLPRAFVRELKRRGGALRLRTSVDEIVVENGRAAGVRVGDETLRAPIVVSNADPATTYGRLLGRPAVARELSWSMASLSLFAVVDRDLRADGFDSGNYWDYARADLDAIYAAEQAGDAGVPGGLFATVTTLKDATRLRGTRHTVELFAPSPYAPWARWAGTPSGERPPEYEAFKATQTARMMAGLERVIPGAREALVFAELGTPLTNAHFVRAHRGSCYGTEKTLRQLRAFGVRADVPGLYQCGASTLGHGVYGATLSGLVAAAAALRCRPRALLDETGAAPTVVDADAPEAWPERLRRRARAS